MEKVLRGKMHGYLRMYRGKKILEWSSTPEAAFTTALLLKDKYGWTDEIPIASPVSRGVSEPMITRGGNTRSSGRCGT
jgi:hypothetical protein